MLDPFWYTSDKPGKGADGGWGWTLGADQYTWLQRTLESDHSRFTFVFIHHLVGGAGSEARGGIEAAGAAEWGGRNADGTDGFAQRRPGWPAPIHQLLVANGVTAVFHGHDHLYAKQDLDGIVYQEVPQPSVRNGDGARLAADYGYVHGDVRSSSGHLTVTVTPTAATISYVRGVPPIDERADLKNGTVDHTYTLAPSTRPTTSGATS